MDRRVLKGQVTHSHAPESTWIRALNFVPAKGELIVYEPDSRHKESRIKMGDGETLLNDLPFLEIDFESSKFVLDKNDGCLYLEEP